MLKTALEAEVVGLIEFKEKSANMGEKMFFLIINNDIISKKEI